MMRVYVVVEGQTEESFVNDLLAPALTAKAVYLYPLLLGRKGGNPKYVRIRRDVLRQLKQDSSAYCTTMLDLYGLGDDFPGLPLPQNLSNLEKVAHLEEAVRRDVVGTVPNLRADIRFIPYLQLHEFEGLLFSDPVEFARGINQTNLAGSLHAIRAAYATPEDINDNTNTAPSKRVLRVYPQYRKVLNGTQAAAAVGIEAMRRECPHFRSWLERLEQLPT